MEAWWAQGHGGQSTRSWLHQSYDSRSDWSLPIADPGAGQIFDWAVYERGGMTLAALRERIGSADFTEVLRSWVRHHGRGHGTTGQFEALAEQVSGEDLTSFFDAWLVQPVKPAATAGERPLTQGVAGSLSRGVARRPSRAGSGVRCEPPRGRPRSSPAVRR